MAKEQWHNWSKVVFLAVVITFACGGYAIQVKNNTGKITEHSTKIDANIEKIHVLQLSDKDIANLAQKSVDYMGKIDGRLTSIQTEQIKQAHIQAVNSEKLKQLTKD